MQSMTNQIFNSENENTWVWKEDENGMFPVKFAYNLLQNVSAGENNQV